MPHDHDCPYSDCGKKVLDWFLEWYPRAKQYEIGKRQLAMDCPWCRRPVVLKNRLLAIPSSPMNMEVRSYDQATEYAKQQPEAYPSLEAFLSDPKQAAKVAPYKHGYWPNVSIP
jgi:hypothetical protein